jgi:hypothetical protein
MKTFDLFEKHKFGKNVQNNLKILEQEYGKKFNIKYDKILILVSFIKIKISTNGFSFYSLIYDIPNKTSDIVPLRIDFYDINLHKINNNSYIANIHKTDTISGTEMVKIALLINKVLHVKKTMLYDATTIKCQNQRYDLSYMKLLQTNLSFYMKFGFEFDINNRYQSSDEFNNKKEKHKYIIALINKCKKITIVSIKNMYMKLLDLLFIVLKEQQYDKIQIFGKNNTFNEDYVNIWNIKIMSDTMPSLFNQIYRMIGLLNNTKQKYLYQLMIDLFNDKINCVKYDLIERYIIHNDIFKIIYKKNIINFEFLDCFKILKNLRYSYFSYTFY